MGPSHTWQRWSVALSWTTAAAAAAVLLAWTMDLPFLRALHPSFPSMKANAALGIVLLSLATLMLAVQRYPVWRRLAGWASVGLGGVTLLQYLLGIDLGVDGLVAADQLGGSYTAVPGRMSPLTAAMLVLLGLLLGQNEPAAHPRRNVRLTLMAATIGLIATAGYLFGAPALTGAGPATTGMAVHTLAALLALTLAAGLALGPTGPLKVCLVEGPAGVLVRRGAPVALLGPFAVALAASVARRRGWLESGMEEAVVGVAVVLMMLAVVQGTARKVDRAEAARRDAMRRLRETNRDLERRVEARTAELAAKEQRLRRSNMDLEAYAAVASHDLKAPLRQISGFSELLLERSQGMDEASRSYLRRIREGVSRMQVLTDSLLEYSRAGSAPPRMEHVPLVDVLANVRDILSPQIAESRAVLHVGDLPVVRGDPAQLERVFQNLVQNSLKYAHPGRPPRIVVEGRHAGVWHELTVQDNGQGFDQVEAERLFAVFERLGRTGPGTGLGLAITRRILEEHGGTIQARGIPGEGARFTIRLPALDEGPARVKLAERQATAGLRAAHGPAPTGASHAVAEVVTDGQLAHANRL